MIAQLAAFLFLCRDANAISLRNEASTLSNQSPLLWLNILSELTNPSYQEPAEEPGVRNDPIPELLEPGFKYASPPGSGCDASYDLTPGTPLTSMTPAKDFTRKRPDGTIAWNGFCQMGWSACPDAVVNRDYYYYAKALGTPWVEKLGNSDKIYCKNAGFLNPEIRQIRNNFTALHDKAAELCSTTLNDPKYMQDKLTMGDGIPRGAVFTAANRIRAIAAQAKVNNAREGTVENVLKSLKETAPLVTKYELFDDDGSKLVGAWNCALGDVGCDITYCNWAYCLRPDGSVGQMDECEGFDPIHGGANPF